MKSAIKNLKYFYLFSSIIGGGFTFYFLFLGILENGSFNSLDLIKSTWTTNFYAKSITLDFWVGAIVGTIFVLFEGIRLKMKNIWMYLIATIFIAFAFAFPLFLYMREKKLEENSN